MESKLTKIILSKKVAEVAKREQERKERHRARYASKINCKRDRIERTLVASKTKRNLKVKKRPQVVKVEKVDPLKAPLLDMGRNKYGQYDLIPAKSGEISHFSKKFSMRALHSALKAVETEEGQVPIFVKFVQEAYRDNNVLVNLMKKLLPDLKSVDAKITQESPYKLIIDVSRPQLPEGHE